MTQNEYGVAGGATPSTETSTPTSSHNRQMACDCQVRSLPPASIQTRPVENREVRKGHYEPLTTTFKHDGFNYRQIVREGDFAIYEQRWIRRDGELSENVAFEVIRIQRHEATTFPNGAVYPAREAYPPSEAWGVDGFTPTDKDAAFNKFRQIVAGRTGKTNQLEQAGDGLEQEQTKLKPN